MSLFPYISQAGLIEDGECFQLLPFCKKKCSSIKCKEYYHNLQSQNTGAYCCPYGLSSYVYYENGKKVIFTGLKIKGIYNKKQSRLIESKSITYNPIISESLCRSIAHEIVISTLEKGNLESKLEAIRDLLHEARSLNGQIKNSIDYLWETHNSEDEISNQALIEALKNAHVSSFMISNRFSYFDSILNPSLSIGDPYPAVVFKKFDKMRKLLKGYLRKNVWINIESPIQSNYKYNIYPTFETLLFILLENAIKYSPDNRSVDVYFDQNGNILDVKIQSMGPYCDENELLHLCDKGFRGENAKAIEKSGQGFGLNFAKKICSDHHIDISFNCTYSGKDHGIKYGIFSVLLHFDNTLNIT